MKKVCFLTFWCLLNNKRNRCLFCSLDTSEAITYQMEGTEKVDLYFFSGLHSNEKGYQKAF
ncbi:hypothetical protein JCM9152_2702 [Halalkalibacter hemicellulosilyticusJCM 9152]|uniref:Uncharacterized protein n=1 Tax=Halalkalibacter hemicellulosilyticusJCM 9152 TaxID=1236971 RepID=W4QGK2_9BACI|nr:hypothetical protein JCM9152_2702 [Halalkalibacter hemicellulosilyticusJCM 9152]